jgi:hypothetical protein
MCKKYPDSCVGCEHETPTGMCSKLFDLDKFLKSRYLKRTPFDIAYTRRRKDCPLEGQAAQEATHE